MGLRVSLIPRFLLVSGGAESVSTAIASWAFSRKIPYALFSLRADSILKSAPGVVAFSCVKSGSAEADVATALKEFLVRERLADLRLPAYPTEDDSLRLLHLLECLHPGSVLHSRCLQLPGGGLDKAELFDFLKAAGLQDVIAPTKTLRCVADIKTAYSELGSDLVIKPVSKPWLSNISSDGLKVLSPSALPIGEVIDSLDSRFQRGEVWVAQKRLYPLEGAERSACIVRNTGRLRYAEVAELWKYPKAGGSACWVVTQPASRLLVSATERIAKALDIHGLAELSFLADEEGRPRLLELNTRPWLQAELLVHAGFDVFQETLAVLSGEDPQSGVPVLRERSWVSLERLLQSIWTGDAGQRLRAIIRLRKVLGARPFYSMWSDELPGVRYAWSKRMLRRLFKY